MTNQKRIEIIVDENIPRYQVEIFIVDHDYKPKIAQLKDGFIEWQDVSDGLDTKPTMTINRDIWKAMKEALIDNHERDKNVVESELKATKYHLEDLRTLVFKKK